MHIIHPQIQALPESFFYPLYDFGFAPSVLSLRLNNQVHTYNVDTFSFADLEISGGCMTRKHQSDGSPCSLEVNIGSRRFQD